MSETTHELLVALRQEVRDLSAKVDKILASPTGGGFPSVGDLNSGVLAADADAKAIFAARWNSAKEAEGALDPINAATVENGGQVWNWGPAPNEPGKFKAFTNPSAEATNFFHQGPLYKAAAAKKAAQPDLTNRPAADVTDDGTNAGRKQP